MAILDRLTGWNGLGLVLPAAAVLTAAVATVVLSLDEMAGEVNRIEEQLSFESVEAAMKATLRRLADTNHDYAQWDDAVRHLYGTADQDFVDGNFASSTADPVMFDTVFLLDESGNDVFGFSGGETLSVAARAFYGPSVDALLEHVPRDGRSYEAATGVLVTARGLAVVSAGPVVPTEEAAIPRPAHARILIISRILDGAALARLGDDYQIDNLRLAGADATVAPKLILRDPGGVPVGALTWSTRALGDQAHAEVSPVTFVMLGLVGLTMVFLVAIALRSLRELRQREAQARHAATHDSLTGLANRPATIALLDEVLGATRQGGRAVAVVFADLDGFKAVNDAYGHETGDTVIKVVAEAFAALVGGRPLARFGGDEFVVAIVDENAGKIAYEIGVNLIRLLSAPINIAGRTITLGTSVGIAVAGDNKPTGEELLRRADVAMYQAKQQGRGRVFVYDPLIDAIRHERLEMAARLRAALARDDLELVYQPIFDANTRRIVATEALVRWNVVRFGDVSPSVFIEVAEESGLIDQLGLWTLQTACRDARGWTDVTISINASPAQFRNPGFEQQVSRVLSETGLPPARLNIEVTESYFVSRPEEARRTIELLRALGVAVALDDFGTGYSSIGYLRQFAFDKLKLDRSMIVGIANDERVQRVVQATVALADALGIAVTAEGVETEAELLLLRAAGCRQVQGFHLARPCAAAEFTALLAGPKVVALHA